MAMAARSKLRAMLASSQASIHTEFITWFFAELSRRAVLPKGDVVRTRGNLSVRVFQDIVMLIGVNYRSEYSIAEKPIIERLLQLRNGIAHGDWHKIDEAEFEQLYREIDKLMVLFCNDIEAAAAGLEFKRAEMLSVT
jgi:hypothetical protein